MKKKQPNLISCLVYPSASYFSVKTKKFNSKKNTWKSVRTRTCHTFSLAPSKLQNRMLTPRRPCPPHMLLGVTDVSLSSRVLLLYTSIFTGFSTFAFNRSLRVSLSLFCKCSDKSLGQCLTQQASSPTAPLLYFKGLVNTVHYQHMYLQLFYNELAVPSQF